MRFDRKVGTGIAYIFRQKRKTIVKFNKRGERKENDELSN